MSNNKLVIFIKDYFFFILLFSFGGFLRFYNVTNRYSLGVESVRDANVAIMGASQFIFPLTGPFSSFGPFTFGPWYWYHLIFFHILFPFYYSSWVILGISSMIFIYLMYKIGEILGGKKLGLTIAALTVVCRYLIAWVGLLSNPGFVFVYAALSIFIFLKICRDTVSQWWWMALGLAIGVGINIHYQMLPYLLLPIILVVSQVKKFHHFLFSCLGVFISFIPLIIFDCLHNGYTIRNFLHSYLTLKERIYVANSWRIYLFDFWPDTFSFTLGISRNIGILLIILIGCLFWYLLIKRKLRKELVLLSIFFVVAFLQLRYYGGERSMSYMHYLMPFVFIYVGYFVWYLSTGNIIGKYLYVVILGYLLYVMTLQGITQLRSDPFIESIYSQSTGLSNKYESQKISLYHCKTQDPGVIMSILFVLEKEKRISEKGAKIALSGTTCDNTFVKNRDKNITKFVLEDKTKMLDITKLSTEQLASYGWEQYTMQKIFTASAFWWVGKKI